MQLSRIVVLAICFWLGGSFSKAVGVEAKGIKTPELKMTVTAYYKPLPNQKKYVKGSYKKDVKMNGSGKKTSSGSVPEEGTLAADKLIFPEGTVFHVPGFGRGTAKDTGGKIKGRRLDLFMGEGDAGREKAVAWGNKKIKVLIVSKL